MDTLLFRLRGWKKGAAAAPRAMDPGTSQSFGSVKKGRGPET